MEQHFTRIEVLWLWLALAVATLSGQLPRLFNPAELPPSDPTERAEWARKRLWLAVCELSALPGFATMWTAAALNWNLPVALVVLGSMASGALGFGFLLHALQVIVNRKLGQ